MIIVSAGNRGQWPLGRVTKLHPDEEGIVRIVEVVTRGNKMLKTVEKLVPLEFATCGETMDSDPSRSENNVEGDNPVELPSNPLDEQVNLVVDERLPVTATRPTRKAAQRATAQRRQLIADGQL